MALHCWGETGCQTFDWIGLPSSEPNLWESLKPKYPVFKGTLGEVTGITEKLVVKEKAIPKFFKPCPVPYAQKQNVSEELE